MQNSEMVNSNDKSILFFMYHFCSFYVFIELHHSGKLDLSKIIVQKKY